MRRTGDEMLHILWLILRLILILLGIVLGLVLLVLLLVLFCPVCYQASASKEPETEPKDSRLVACVSWLFHGVSLKVVMDHGKLEKSVRIIGIPVDKIRNRRVNAAKTRKRRKEETSDSSEEHSLEIPEQQMNVSQDAEPETEPETMPEELPEAESETMPEEIPEAETELSQKPLKDASKASPSDTEEVSKKPSRVRRAAEKILGFPAEIIRRIRRLITSVREKTGQCRSSAEKMRSKKEWWKNFLSSEKTKKALSLVWSDGKALIRHVFPRKLSGNVRFDSEDPAVTGAVLALLGMTIPMHKNCIKVTPLFENENYLAGHIRLKGRFYGIVFLWTFLEIYFNNNVKYVIRRWRHKEVS